MFWMQARRPHPLTPSPTGRGGTRGWRAGAALLATLALALLLAGCGGAGAIGGAGGASSGGASSGGASSGGASSGGGTTAPIPTRTSRAGTGRTQPCKGTPTPPSAPPSATLRGGGVGAQPVSVPVGSVVEIRLSGGNVWSLSKIAPAGGLTPSGAQGALEQGDCVWDFAVAQAGDVTVSFVGTALCPPDVACPAYAILAQFTIRGV